MIKVKHVIVLTFLLVILPFCGKNPVEPAPDPDWVALTSRINGSQIYLVDLNNPTHYKQITDNNHTVTLPKFSPDRSKLIFLDLSAGGVHNPLILIYDLERGTVDSLVDPTLPFPVIGNHPIVFTPDGSRLYFHHMSSWNGIEIFYYVFSEQSVFCLTNTPDPSEWVAGIIGSDTLIVFSNDPAAPGQQPWGFYLMNLKGEYLRRLDNPHLELINVNGVNRKAAYNPEWNYELRLFVFAQVDSTIPGYKIAITDLHGNYYQTYTSGQYIDDYPAWGPGGQTVLFHRRNVRDYSGPYKVMIIDLQTSAVKEFVKPQVIDGATGLSFPDY